MTVQAERILQAEVMLRLRAAAVPVIALPIPNGIWIPARTAIERGLVARIIARMKTDGMLRPGACDIALLWSDGCGCLELKAPARRDLLGARQPAGRPSESQREFAAECAALGVKHAYCDSWDAVRTTLAGWGRL